MLMSIGGKNDFILKKDLRGIQQDALQLLSM